MFKTQINPTTGKMETIGGPSSPLPTIPLAELRKATRDVIEGNTQFHTDPEWGEKKEEENSDDTYNYFSTDLF
jgi:hypothetical protein